VTVTLADTPSKEATVGADWTEIDWEELSPGELAERWEELEPYWKALPIDERKRVWHPKVQEEADLLSSLIGEELMLERRRRGLRQEDVALRIGRSRGWVGQCERGENGSEKASKLYAIALGIDYAVVVARAEDKIESLRKHSGE